MCYITLFGLPRLTSTTYLYGYKLLPFDIMYEYESTILVFKMVNNLFKHDFTLITNREASEIERTTRQSNNICILPGNELLADAINFYNNLDQTERTQNSLELLKRLLKNKILSNSCKYELVSPFIVVNWSGEIMLNFHFHLYLFFF